MEDQQTEMIRLHEKALLKKRSGSYPDAITQTSRYIVKSQSSRMTEERAQTPPSSQHDRESVQSTGQCYRGARRSVRRKESSTHKAQGARRGDRLTSMRRIFFSFCMDVL